MRSDDIIYILKILSKKFKILYRPHPALFKNKIKIESIEISNPFEEDIKVFYEKTKKIITGNSSVLFESIYLKKTTFLWTENVINKFGEINNKDRYCVLKNNYCLELNKNNIHEIISINHKLDDEQYRRIFPSGYESNNCEKLAIKKIISI